MVLGRKVITVIPTFYKVTFEAKFLLVVSKEETENKDEEDNEKNKNNRDHRGH